MSPGAPTLPVAPEDIYSLAEAVSKRIAVESSERDRDRRFPAKEMMDLSDSGLSALMVPREAGGGGGSTADYFNVLARIAQGDPNVAHMLMQTYLISRMGIHGLKGAAREKFMARLVNDGVHLAACTTELGTKTIFDFKTRLYRQGPTGWTIDGTKYYCTGSQAAGLFFVAALPDDMPVENAPDLVGTTYAIVDAKAAGISVSDDWDGMGQRNTSSGTVTFVEVPVADDWVFIFHPDPLNGILNMGGFGALLVGIAQGALNTHVEWLRAKARPVAFSQAAHATEDPYTLRAVGELGTLVSGVTAHLEHLCRAVNTFETDPTPANRAAASVAASALKVHASSVAAEVGQRLFYSASATMERVNLHRFWRNAVTLTSHNSNDYRLRMIGDFLLNGAHPPAGGLQ